MLEQILPSGIGSLWGIPQHAKHAIAGAAQYRSNLPGYVTMIYGKSILVHDQRIAAADCAHSTLLPQHGLESGAIYSELGAASSVSITRLAMAATTVKVCAVYNKFRAWLNLMTVYASLVFDWYYSAQPSSGSVFCVTLPTTTIMQISRMPTLRECRNLLEFFTRPAPFFVPQFRSRQSGYQPRHTITTLGSETVSIGGLNGEHVRWFSSVTSATFFRRWAVLGLGFAALIGRSIFLIRARFTSAVQSGARTSISVEHVTRQYLPTFIASLFCYNNIGQDVNLHRLGLLLARLDSMFTHCVEPLTF